MILLYSRSLIAVGLLVASLACGRVVWTATHPQGFTAPLAGRVYHADSNCPYIDKSQPQLSFANRAEAERFGHACPYCVADRQD